MSEGRFNYPPQVSAEGSGLATPATTTPGMVAAFDDVSGTSLRETALAVNPSGEASGVTRFDVDNLRLDGGTLSSTSGALTLNSASGDVMVSGASIAGISNIKANNGDYWFRTNTDIRLGFNQHVVFCTGNVESGADVGLRRSGPGILILTDANAAQGRLLASREIEASIAGVDAPNVLAATESRKLLTNSGATAEAYNTLPNGAMVGCEFQFLCSDADGIRVTAPSGEVISMGPGLTSAAAGFVRSVVVGSGLTLTKVDANTWASINLPNGTWTIDA